MSDQHPPGPQSCVHALPPLPGRGGRAESAKGYPSISTVGSISRTMSGDASRETSIRVAEGRLA